MIFDITHTTAYVYSRPVFLEPHTLRLRPRNDGRQTLTRFDLQIEPTPAGLTSATDPEGNSIARVWFDGVTESFRVTSRFTVETHGGNPYDYLPDTAAKKLPMVYAEDLREHLVPCLKRVETAGNVRRWTESLVRETDHQTLPFLFKLNESIYQNFDHANREHGNPHPPHVTLGNRGGSCRDLAVLFMEACRAQGIAARFVSGYHEGEAANGILNLHGWAEVFIPGGGWRGYDPTHGLAVADSHVAIAASAAARDTLPITGAFRGTGATATMTASIQIQSL